MTTKKKTAKKENTAANGWPRITEGSHLRVIEHENGRRELVWDDEALMRDVRSAIAAYENSAPVVVKPASNRSRKSVKS